MADCGVRTQQKSGRIVGGTASKFGKWPWQALVKEVSKTASYFILISDVLIINIKLFTLHRRHGWVSFPKTSVVGFS